MGFFDRFKKNNVKNENVQSVKELPFDIEYSQLANGNLQVEFYEKDVNSEKPYDTTRLIVGTTPLNMAGHRVYNCAASWYGRGDCCILNKETGKMESLRATQYRGVFTEINLELLQKDKNYCYMVMKGLLDKERVEKYLENGLQENPKKPCGKYIGGISKTEKGYEKFFTEEVGMASHNSKLMVERRQENRLKVEAIKQHDIEAKKEQIRKLQSELDEMQR